MAVCGRDVSPLGLGEVFAKGHFKRLRAGETHAFSDRIVDNVDVAHDRSSGLGGECVCERRLPRKNALHDISTLGGNSRLLKRNMSRGNSLSDELET